MSKRSELEVLLKAGTYAHRRFQPPLVQGVIMTAELSALAKEVGMSMSTARVVARVHGLHETSNGVLV